jgi:outer membrane protein OmpA-like peptidoglycan-associated protein
MNLINKTNIGINSGLIALFLIFLGTINPINSLANANAPIDRLTLITDESWEVGKQQTEFGEYPLSKEAILAAQSALNGGSTQAVVANFYGQSTLIEGAKPIWRNKRASNDWESYQFKKVFMVRNNLINAATFKINCDDAARVYINGHLLNSNLQTVSMSSMALKNLTAYFYNRIFTYDIKPYLMAGALNTIIIEAVSEPINQGHAYICAKLDVDFIENTIALKPVIKPTIKPVNKPVIAPKKPIEKVVNAPIKETKPVIKPIETAPIIIEKPVLTEPNIFKTSTDLDAATLKIGDIFELNNIYFKADDYQLNSTSQATLLELAAFLKANSGIKIEIGGHTNLIPTHEYAFKLSSDRAQSVVSFLRERGVSDNQLTFKGYGKSKPKLMEKTAEAHQKNQRVEVKILAK